MYKISIPLLVAVSAFGIAMGIFIYDSDALAYAGTQAETCNNCHVMDPMYENWYHAPHEKWTECVDCHLPHDNPAVYFFEKGRQGFHDVYVFSTGQTPAVIRANENSRAIVQKNCIRCHADTVDSIIMGDQPFKRFCWDCHRDAAHGQRGISNQPHQDSAIYPVK
jgi:cytochrome c nitrite reductase small subunit